MSNRNEPDRGLDVERLARALHDSDLMRRYSEYADALPTMKPTPEHTLCIQWAEVIAREYARSSPAPDPTGQVKSAFDDLAAASASTRATG